MSPHAIVVPCYNEAQRLDTEAFLAYAATHPDVHFVFVDDGSTDTTRAVLERMRAAAPGAVTVLGLDRNGGKAEAVRRGMQVGFARRARYVGYWDADLSTPLADIATFVDLLEGRPELHLVMGSRVMLLGRAIRRRAARHYAGRIFATCASLTLDLPVYDTQCGAKLVRTSAATRWIFRRPFLSRWLFDVEILARLGLVGERKARLDPHACVYEHPLATWHDVAGSKLRLLDFVKAARDLLRIAWRYRCVARRRGR